jgi:hypothetical protein
LRAVTELLLDPSAGRHPSYVESLCSARVLRGSTAPTRAFSPCTSATKKSLVSPAGSWDGVYRHEGNRVREKDGKERTAQRLEVQLSVAD